MKKIFLGDSVITSILGYIGSAITIAVPLLQQGNVSAIDIVYAVLIGLAGRFVQDAKKTTDTTK